MMIKPKHQDEILIAVGKASNRLFVAIDTIKDDEYKPNTEALQDALLELNILEDRIKSLRWSIKRTLVLIALDKAEK